ncbi:MAG: hypothetical protein KatS3mg111_0283 [Pirellulaceae bacterium]|nr:MAG: hypothetical protein KatS3mg111_0283 [Pirellulaceae bacterium]
MIRQLSHVYRVDAEAWPSGCPPANKPPAASDRRLDLYPILARQWSKNCESPLFLRMALLTPPDMRGRIRRFREEEQVRTIKSSCGSVLVRQATRWSARCRWRLSWIDASRFVGCERDQWPDVGDHESNEHRTSTLGTTPRFSVAPPGSATHPRGESIGCAPIQGICLIKRYACSIRASASNCVGGS